MRGRIINPFFYHFHIKRCLNYLNVIYTPIFMESLTKQQLGEIFDIVNSTYIGLKGEKKRVTKKACKLWKPDNNLYKMLIALYNCDEINEKIRQPVEVSISTGDCPQDWETKKVSWRTYQEGVMWRDEAIESLEQKLDNVESSKGYLKLDEHEQKIQETKDYFRQENSSLKDDMMKYKNEAQFLRDKMECMEQTHRNLMETKDKTIKSLEQNLFEK